MLKLLFKFNILIGLIICMNTGCSSKPKTAYGAVEVPDASAVVSDDSVHQLFDDAKDAYGRELYSLAKEKFEALKSTYPASPYTRFAEIKIADCQYASGEYDLAAMNYENFLKEHPAYTGNDYISYRAGRSHHLQSQGIGRNISPLEKAIEFYRKLLISYTNSIYFEPAKSHLNEAETTLAAHEWEIIKFYKKRDYLEAYQNRKAEYDKRWASLETKE